MSKAAELRELSTSELESRVAEAKKQLFELRFELATGQIDSVRRVGDLRREVARLKTVMREQELGIARGEKS